MSAKLIKKERKEEKNGANPISGRSLSFLTTSLYYLISEKICGKKYTKAPHKKTGFAQILLSVTSAFFVIQLTWFFILNLACCSLNVSERNNN